MSDILTRILERKTEEVEALLARSPADELRARARDAQRGPCFHTALTTGAVPSLIAEVKKASPSKGIIREDFDPVWIAERYKFGGATALSILTDRDFFQGRLEYIEEVRAHVDLPVLRKDFIVHPAQIDEARIAGASAVLLIAAALAPEKIATLFEAATERELEVLFEIHDEADLERLHLSGVRPRIVGINNRDLRTFVTDLAVTERLAPQLDEGTVIVSESGIFEPADVARVVAAGARVLLVGESLMRQHDPGEAARRLLAPTSPQAEARP